MELTVGVDDPRAEDVAQLLATRLGFSRGVTPAGYAFALDVDQLVDPDVTFVSARTEGALVGIAALRRLDATHGEIKSMHTRESERGRGVRRALVEQIVAFAGRAGYRRLMLETGTTEEFAPARALYARIGFEPCEAFVEYRPSPYNTFMSLSLDWAP